MQQPPNTHLAELNIGRLRYPLEDPRIADFANNLDLINGLAERSEGFVWRYTDESGNASETRMFDDPNVIMNVSVWTNMQTFEHFVWQTVHKRFYGRRPEWFAPFEGPSLVMWWTAIGHFPTPAEAKLRLEHLKAHGPSDYAFSWQSVPSAQLWKTARCGNNDERVA